MTMKIRFTLLILLISLYSQSATAQAASTPSKEVQTREIHVTAERQIKDLRFAIDHAQDKIYDLFNALNDLDDFDVHCEMVAPLGTKIKSKVCLPNFSKEAGEAVAQAYIVPSPYGKSPTPISAVNSHKTPMLKEMIIELAKENPELNQAIFEYSDLQAELVELLKP